MKGWDRFARQVNQEHLDVNKAISHHLSGLGITENLVKDLLKRISLPQSILLWDEAVLKGIASELRKMTKPMIIAANKADVDGAERNIELLRKEFPDCMIIPCSAESELALREANRHGLIDYVAGDSGFTLNAPEKLSDRQKAALEFIRSDVLKRFGSTGVQQVLNDAVFGLLKHIAVYPVANSHLADKDGNVLPDCFLIPAGSTALDFAFRVHSDIGRAFIRAIDLRTKKIVGREHNLKDGDVLEIVSAK